MFRITNRIYTRLLIFTTALALAACASSGGNHASAPADGTRATLAILESTDIHSNLVGYDYYKLAEDKSIGFDRLATLVREARKQYENTLLFDDGDTIQGTALSDWQAHAAPLPCSKKLTVYKAMDALGYDGGTIGNHEFNYGLPFLAQVTGHPMNVDGVSKQHCAGPHFPQVLANVVSARDNQPIFPPFAVLDRTIKIRDASGRESSAPIRIGIIGFTPPTVANWDKHNLAGKVIAQGLVESAQKHLPALLAKNVDFVIAISHGGFDTSPYSPEMESANWYLAEVPGIDVLLLGHSHLPFPAPNDPKSRFNNLPEVDNVRGFVHGKPAVMGNFWGKSLGVIELALMRNAGKWTIDTAATHSEVRNTRNADGSYVAPDPEIDRIVQADHAATIAFVSSPIGDSDFAMTTYFAEIGNITAIQPINMAQRDFAMRKIKADLPALAGIPVLSAAAPYRNGFGGPGDYTDIEPGPIAIHNAADLYPYPNTFDAVKIDGASVKAWLEHAAIRFNQIDPTRSDEQPLLNLKVPGYNLDVIQGDPNGADISYRVDVTKPVGERIVDLHFNGKPIDPKQAFIVTTNNYRANGGGRFPGLDGSQIVLSTTEGNRELLIDWVRSLGHLTRAQNGADRNWRFVPVKTAGPITLSVASDKLAVAHAAGIDNVRVLRDNGYGTTTYAVDLSRD